MKSLQKAAFYLLIWVVVGISTLTSGFFLHNGLGWLLSFIGLLVTSAALYVWVAVAIQLKRQSLPEEAPKSVPASEPLFSQRADGDGGTPIPRPENGNPLLPALQRDYGAKRRDG